MPFATAKDGCQLYYELKGKEDDPVIFVTYPWCDSLLETYSAFGLETVEVAREANRTLLEKLEQRFKIVLFDYPRGVGQTERKKGDLTADTIASDYLALADEVGAERFVAFGYSWSAVAALQVAIRTERCAGVVIGGWPPLSAPYDLMLDYFSSTSSRLMSWGFGLITGNPFLRMLLPKSKRPGMKALAASLKSTANTYRSIVGNWDEETEIRKLKGPRLTLFGSGDVGSPSMGVELPLAENNRKRKKELEELGWRVLEVEGFGHEELSGTPEGVEKFANIVLEELESHQW